MAILPENVSLANLGTQGFRYPAAVWVSTYVFCMTNTSNPSYSLVGLVGRLFIHTTFQIFFRASASPSVNVTFKPEIPGRLT